VPQQAIDWPAFQRLDNAAVVAFLTASAGALSARGLIGPKDADNLRLALSGIAADGESREKPLLLELQRVDADFLATLVARYGTAGVCLNLARHTLLGSVAETRRLLADFGQALLKKADLLFNRPFFIYQGPRCERRVLYSTLLVDFSEELARACLDLGVVIDDLGLMNPSDLAGASTADRESDLEVAKALGFNGLVDKALPGRAELQVLRRIAYVAHTISDATAEVGAQLAANGGGDAAWSVASASEGLRAEAQRLASLDFPRGEGLPAWEVRRRGLAAGLASINEALRLVSSAMQTAVNHQEPPAPPARPPEAVRRRVAFDMIAGGLPPQTAVTAAKELFRYLDTHHLEPKNVLVGELPRIHSALPPRALETLTALADNSPGQAQSTAEKASTMSRSKRLGATFAATLARTTPVLALCLAVLGSTLGGCGLKTRPKSDLADLRPDVPFQAGSAVPGDGPTLPKPAVDASGRPNETQPPPPVGITPGASAHPTAPAPAQSPEGATEDQERGNGNGLQP
jgi:hypothetical protein